MTTIFLLLLLFLSFSLKPLHDLISFYYLTPRRIRRAMRDQGISGPEPKFVVGNILDVASLVTNSTSNDMAMISHDIVARLLPHYALWSKQYGKRFIYWNGVEPRMCLTDTELIKEFFSKYGGSHTGKSWLQQQGSEHFIGRGLLMANGDDWHRQRRVLSIAFTIDRLKIYAGYVEECTSDMIKTWENSMESGKTVISAGEYMKELAADIISRVEFGSSYEKGKQIFHRLMALQQLCAQASRHLCLPGSRYLPTRYNKARRSMKMDVERLLMEIIQTRKDCIEMGSSSGYGDDLLGILLNETMTKNKMKFGCNNVFADMQVIMDECKTFFFAGHETVALLLTWTIMLLATNLTWQEKVREEFIRVCGGDGMPSIDHLPKLTVLNMVINESLRLYPPATVLPRMSFDNIMLGDLHIPKGLSIWIPVLDIHHSRELWGEDANEFNPLRFESKSSFQSSPPCRFIPFATGPRNCIGQSFAKMEAKIVLGMLMSKFRFTISDTYRHAPIVVLTIKPKYDVQVCLEPLDKPISRKSKPDPFD